MSYTSFQILGQGSFGVVIYFRIQPIIILIRKKLTQFKIKKVYLSKNNKNELISVKCKLQLNDYYNDLLIRLFA